MIEYDTVNHPKHYTAHPSGVECIQITEHMGFCLGECDQVYLAGGSKAWRHRRPEKGPTVPRPRD